jgi:hypothetical protein
MIGILILSAVCLAILIAINWYAGDNLTVSDFTFLVFVSLIPLVNVLTVAFFIWAMMTDSGIKSEVVMLKGRGA